MYNYVTKNKIDSRKKLPKVYGSVKSPTILMKSLPKFFNHFLPTLFYIHKKHYTFSPQHTIFFQSGNFSPNFSSKRPKGPFSSKEPIYYLSRYTIYPKISIFSYDLAIFSQQANFEPNIKFYSSNSNPLQKAHSSSIKQS